MLVKLPIKVNNRIFNETFILSYTNNEIILKKFRNSANNELIEIIYTNNFGIKIYPIVLPLIFSIYNNYLINEYFFIFSLFLENKLETNNFLVILLNTINKNFNKNFNFIKLNKIKFNLIEKILKLIIVKTNVDTDNLNYYYLKYQFYLNISLGIIFTKIDLNRIELSKRIKTCINELFKIKFNFYGSNNNLLNHIKNITETKYNKSYPPKFKKKLIIKNVLITLLDENLTSCIFNILYKNNNFNNFILYIINKNTDHLIDLYPDKIEYICSDKISFSFYKTEISDNEFNIEVIKKLYTHYLHSFNYSRTDFSYVFKKILYYLYYFNDYINLNIKCLISTIKNYKLKNIINNINQFYLKYKKQDLDVINNINFYSNSSINYIILLHFTDQNDFFIRNNYFKMIKTKFYSNIKLYQVYNQLEWINIKYKLDYIKLLNISKENNLFFTNNKFNKFIFKNISSNIISIINNPFIMCNYLRKKSDFVKLTVYFSTNLNNIFFNNIKINKENYEKIGNILYYISNIKNQDITDNNYNIIINYLRKNRNFVFFNKKINININHLFNRPINLGILAKNIQNINIPIELNNIYNSSCNSTSEDTIDQSIEYSNEQSSLHINSRNYITIEESMEESSINDYYTRNIQEKITIYMNKYLKYKKKYLETKL